MKVCILDQNQKSIDELHSLLFWYANEKNIEISCDFFNDANDFMDNYVPELYDIIFLDTQIANSSLSHLAKFIRANSKSAMIIFTSKDNRAMEEAFLYHGFEYIVKPPNYSRIKSILDDATEVLPRLEKYISIPTKSENIRFPVSTIIYATSSGHYIDFNLRGGYIKTIRMTVSKLKETLCEDDRFIAINKGIVVNMDHIVNISDTDCIMSDGTTLPIKVKEALSIKQSWHDYNFEIIKRGQKVLI